MPALADPRQEAFANALAMGLSGRMACAEAGYARNLKQARDRATRLPIAARVGELRDERHWDEASDAAPVIGALMRLARKAGDMPTAAAMGAARGLLAEAAKLKGRLEDKADKPIDISPIDERFLPLSDEDWIAKFVPRG